MQRKASILFISTYFPPYIKGGAELSTSYLVESLNKNNYDCSVLTSNFEKNNWIYNGINVIPKLSYLEVSNEKNNFFLSKYVQNFILPVKIFFETFIFVKNNPKDIVQIIPHSYYSLYSVLACVILKRKIIIDIRSNFLFLSLKDKNLHYGKNLISYLYFIYDLINVLFIKFMIILVSSYYKNLLLVSLSKYIRTKLINHHFPKEKIFVIYNMYDQKNNINYKKGNILYVTFAGRLVEAKGIWSVLECAILLKKYPFIFNIVGTGPLEQQIREFIIEKQLSNVYLRGKLQDFEVIKLYRESFCIVAPSIWDEPFGRFVQESYYTETPLITTNRGGISEEIKHLETGVLVNPMQPKEIADAILLLKTNTDLYKKIVNNLHELKNVFSETSILKKRIHIYTKLLSNH